LHLIGIPLLSLTTSLLVIFNQFAIREGRYKAIAVRNALQPALAVTSQLALAPFSSAGLVTGQAVGRLVAAWGLIRGTGVITQPRAIDFPRIRATIGRYRRFPLLSAPAVLLNTLSLQYPVIAMAGIYGPDAAGQFAIANLVLVTPLAMVGTAIGQVFLSEFAASLREGRQVNERIRLFERTTLFLLMAALPIALAGVLLSPTVFPLVLGSDWQQSGEFAQAIAFALAARLVAAPLSPALNAMERNGLQLGLDTLRVVALGVATVIAILSNASPVHAVWLLSIAMAMSYVVIWLTGFWAVRASNAHD
jgi:O-antigen/teichoic acid export membrane protein